MSAQAIALSQVLRGVDHGLGDGRVEQRLPEKILAVVVALMLIVAACGGSGGSEETTTTDGATDTTEGSTDTTEASPDTTADSGASGDKVTVRWFIGLGAGGQPEQEAARATSRGPHPTMRAMSP